MVYSVQESKNHALETKLRRAKLMAKNPEINSDFAKAYPHEVREFATVKKFTQLEKRIKEEHQKDLEAQQQRREKLGERL